MDILNAAGGPYFDGVDVSRSQDGDWFKTDLSIISASFELVIASAITADLCWEFTADPAKARGISRVVLPDGCFHTNASGVSLPSARTTIALAAVATGATFSVSVSAAMVGWMRCRFLASSGGGANPKLYAYMQGSRGES